MRSFAQPALTIASVSILPYYG